MEGDLVALILKQGNVVRKELAGRGQVWSAGDHKVPEPQKAGQHMKYNRGRAYRSRMSL